jgi:hypothetical protein
MKRRAGSLGLIFLSVRLSGCSALCICIGIDTTIDSFAALGAAFMQLRF